MARKTAPYGISLDTGEPRKLLSDWFLRDIYGGGLPGFARNIGVPIDKREPAEFTDDWYMWQNPEWSAPLWHKDAFANISPRRVSTKVRPNIPISAKKTIFPDISSARSAVFFDFP